MKRKGIRFERELIHALWSEGFAAVRSAGSGSSGYPSPDIVASNGKLTLAIEAKVREKLPLYIPAEKVRELVMFSNLFGAKPVIALKIKKEKWRFFEVDMLIQTEKGYKISRDNFYDGKELGEILDKFYQERL
ncbi:Holliday junction resolvase Hjc [Geoglobus sp.]